MQTKTPEIGFLLLIGNISYMQSKTKLVGLLVLSIAIFVNLFSEAHALELVHPPIQHVSTDSSGLPQFETVDESLGSEALKLQETNYQKTIPGAGYLAMGSLDQTAKTKQGWFSKMWSWIVQKGNTPITNPTLISLNSALQRMDSKIGMSRLYGKNVDSFTISFLKGNYGESFKQIGIIALKTSAVIAGATALGVAAGAGWLAATGQGAVVTSFFSGLWGSVLLVARNSLNYIRNVLAVTKDFIVNSWKWFDNLTKVLSRTANRISNSINKFISISTNLREEVEGWLKAGERAKSLLKWVSGSFVGLATLLSTWWSVAPANTQIPNAPAIVTTNQSGQVNKKTATVNTASNTKSPSVEKTTAQGTSSAPVVRSITQNTPTQDSKKVDQNNATQTTKDSSVTTSKVTTTSGVQKASTAKVSSTASSSIPKSSETKTSAVSLTGVSSAVKSLGTAINKLGTSLARFTSSDIPRFVSAGYLGSENKGTATPYQKTTMFAWIISAGAVSTLGGILAYGRIKRRQKQNLIPEVLIS